MLMKQLIEVYDLLDSSYASGKQVEGYLKGIRSDADVEVYTLEGPKGKTDMVKVRIPGTKGKNKGMDAPTIGLLGRLGGLGARTRADRLCVRRRRSFDCNLSGFKNPGYAE